MRPFHLAAALGGLLPLALIACAQGQGRGPECAPDEWDVSEITAELVASDIVGAGAEAGVLKWRIHEDDRPLYIESVIVAARDGGRWVLAHLYRHPRERRRLGWQLSAVDDAPHVPYRAYASPPTDAEVEAFLVDTWWDVRANGFERLDGADCERWW